MSFIKHFSKEVGDTIDGITGMWKEKGVTRFCYKIIFGFLLGVFLQHYFFGENGQYLFYIFCASFTLTLFPKQVFYILGATANSGRMGAVSIFKLIGSILSGISNIKLK